MKLMIATIASMTLLAGTAFADGFVCKNEAGDLVAKAYNQTNPDEGTRNAAVMVLSNPTLNAGNRTIARFRAPQTLSNSSSSYVARVDLRFNDHRSGEYLAGTRLGAVKNLTLDVDFSYATPRDAGSELGGLLTIEKRNGDVIYVDLDCTRYLRN